MKNIELNNSLSLDEQREKLLELNPDIIYGVYKLQDNSGNNIELELVENIMTCYPNQLSNIKIPDECENICIINLWDLRKWKVNFLHGNTSIDDSEKFVLLSNGVVEFIEWSSWKKHLITTLRDWWAADQLQRTTTAGRNTWYDLQEEIEREHYEEWPFLWKNDNWEYCLAIAGWNSAWSEYTKESIEFWLKNKYTLDENIPEDKKFIDIFERNFPWIKYEQLWEILNDIIKNDRFISYDWEKSQIEWIWDEMKDITILNWKTNSIHAYTYFDKQNNTLEYRDVRRIKSIPDWFHLLGNRPCKLFLESQNQYPRVPRLENAHKNNAVPTIEHISKQVETILKWSNMEQSILDFLEENKDLSINDYNWDILQSILDWKLEPLHIRKSKKQKDPIERISYNIVYSSDSSVFSIDDDHVLKLYNSHWIKTIQKYTYLQNLLSQSTYTIKESWEINNQKFQQVDVSTLPFNSEWIFWNDDYCFSIVPKSQSKLNLAELKLDSVWEWDNSLFKDPDYQILLEKIIQHINAENLHSVKLESFIHWMNFAVQWVENWILKLQITDTWNLIDDFLKLNK